MENLADRKIISYILKGSLEFNNVQRIIDFNLLIEAIHFDFKSLSRIIKEYYNEYRAPPSYSLLRDNLIKDYDNLQLLDWIEEEECDESEIKFYINQVRKRYNAYLAKVLSEAADYNEDFDYEEYNRELGRIQSKIERLHKDSVFAEGYIKDSVDERLGRYLYTEKNPDEINGIFLGYKDLDYYTWGIKKSELMIISGASASGKSLLMMNIAINAWLGSNDPLKNTDQIIDDGKNVLFVSLEMSKTQLEQRLDSCISNIATNNLTRGKLSSKEKERYFKALDFCKKYNKHFYICDMPRGSRTLDIEARFDTISSEFTPDLVCVDYLGIMKPNLHRKQDWLDMGHAAEDLHEFCRSKDIPVITAAQRKTKKKNAKKQYHDVEEIGRSKMIGDNANIVFLIENRDEENLRDDMVIHVAKNRSGAKGKVTLLKNFETAKISSLPDNWTGEAGDENNY